MDLLSLASGFQCLNYEMGLSYSTFWGRVTDLSEGAGKFCFGFQILNKLSELE